MRKLIVVSVILLSLCIVISGSFAKSSQALEALVKKAEKANAAGDKIGALQLYTEALSALRLSGKSRDRVAALTNERDKIVTELLLQITEIRKQQAEILKIQNDITKNVDKVVKIDQDVQSRVKKNQRKLKDIESELLAVTN